MASYSEDERQAQLTEYTQHLEDAEKLIPLIGQMYRKNNVVTTVYGKSLVNCNVIDIVRAHRFSFKYTKRHLTVHDTFPMLKAISAMDLGACRVDIGHMMDKYTREGASMSLPAFLYQELAPVEGPNKQPLLNTPQPIVLYGFGRIGRLLARILIEKIGAGDKLVLRAVVVRSKGPTDLEKRASLLRRDSVHGPFHGNIRVDKERNCLIANGVVIQFIYANSPSDIDYTKYGIHDAICIDNTGMYRDEKGLSNHLRPGIAKVVLTAPGNDIPNIVYGVNTHEIKPECKILAAASCTTNCVAPVLSLVDSEYGIETGHIETIHSYTNDQNLIDNIHKKSRRGRAAGLNMVITETGAAKAVTKCLPQLAGKLTGNAIRVPTPNVSLAILMLNLKRSRHNSHVGDEEKEGVDVVADEDVVLTPQALNDVLREASMSGPLSNQLDYSASKEIVSSDFVGTRATAVIDSQSTVVVGNRVNIYVWYDNEFGYSCQVIRLVQHLAGAKPPLYPASARKHSVTP